VEEVQIDTLPGYDGFIVGSPNYFGTMAWPVKKFIDESVKYYKKLEGKERPPPPSPRRGSSAAGAMRCCWIS
jgi:multimeric flavodoxin WrbA